MSESIAKPWIRRYLIDVAENYGSKIFDAPQNKKGQKAQIIEFLTYTDESDDKVWAIISDKQTSVPVQFTNEAMKHYNSIDKVTGIQNRRLTSRKGCIATIKHFRPFFGRIPRKNSKELDKSEHLALAVDFVHVIGSDHEGIFGSPKDVGKDEDIALWVKGLREGGGGGNILQQRKFELNEASHRQSKIIADRPKGTTTAPAPIALSSRTSADKMETSEHASPSKKLVKEHDDGGKSLLARWKSSWKHISRNPLEYALMPFEAERALLSILKFGQDVKENDPEEHRTSPPLSPVVEEVVQDVTNRRLDLENPSPEKVRQTTPSVWAPSEYGDFSSPMKPNELPKGLSGNPSTALFPPDGHERIRAQSQLHDVMDVEIEISHDAQELVEPELSPQVEQIADRPPSDSLKLMAQGKNSVLPTISLSQKSPLQPDHISRTELYIREQQQHSLPSPPSSYLAMLQNAFDEPPAVPASSIISSAVLPGSSKDMLRVPFQPSQQYLESQSSTRQSGSQDGQGRILVPDSDASGIASQGHNASRSQPFQVLPQAPPKSLTKTDSTQSSKVVESQTQSESQQSFGFGIPKLSHKHVETDAKLVAEDNIEEHENLGILGAQVSEYGADGLREENSGSGLVDNDRRMLKDVLDLADQPDAEVVDEDDRQTIVNLEKKGRAPRRASHSSHQKSVSPAKRLKSISPDVDAAIMPTQKPKGNNSQTRETTKQAIKDSRGHSSPSVISDRNPVGSPSKANAPATDVHQYDPAAWNAPAFLKRKRNATPTHEDSVSTQSKDSSNENNIPSKEGRVAKRLKMETHTSGATSNTSSKAGNEASRPSDLSPSTKSCNDDTLPKLDGFSVNLDILRDNHGPPWLTWTNIADILLETARTPRN